MIMGTDNADDLELFTNTSSQDKCLLHSQEYEAGSID